MKRKTRIDLISDLNKISSERDTYFKEALSLIGQVSDLKAIISRERFVNNQLLEIMRNGAAEGNFPRRANNG